MLSVDKLIVWCKLEGNVTLSAENLIALSQKAVAVA